jgi:hypothetical protein
MALQMALGDSAVGFNFPEAYARVSIFRGDKNTLLFNVNWYADAAARAADKQTILEKEYQTETPALSGDLVPALYEYLKTLPEFAGALDV